MNYELKKENMENKKERFTPGPWYASTNGGDQGLIIGEKHGENIAVSYDKKDACLIAAAPEMLAALQMVSDELFSHFLKMGINKIHFKRETMIAVDTAIINALGK